MNKESVQQVINDQINPVLALHNGACEVTKVEDNMIFIRLKGGCVGCPSSNITLFNGIEPLLKQNFPQLEDIYLEA